MTDIVLRQMPAFRKAYKKLPPKIKNQVNNAIREIVNEPAVGKKKKGDLCDVYVYKFKIHRQEMLLAYEWDLQTRLLLALGVHENFYRDLKRQKS